MGDAGGKTTSGRSQPPDDEVVVSLQGRQRTYCFFRRGGVDSATAEDLTQEVLIRLWNAKSRNPSLAWDYWFKTCLSVRCDYFRHLPPLLPQAEYEDLPSESSVESQVVTGAWYEQCLSQLDENSKQVVRLHIEQEETFHEIAIRLGKGTDAVKKTYQRAIAKLREWEKSTGGIAGRTVSEE